MNEKSERTTVAVLGTLAEFHREPIPYDLPALVDLVADIHPDLLCLDMTPAQWQQQAFGDLPPEYREGLLPLARQTDIVVVPIGDEHGATRPGASGWRSRAITWLRGQIATIQRTAPGPDAVNQGWRHHLGTVLYGLVRWLAGRETRRAHDAHIDCLTEAVVDVARRNRGDRVLVVVNIQYCHHVRPRLREIPGIQVTSYRDL